MISVNVTNVVTIALISVLGYAGLKFGLKAAGYEPDWL